MTTQDKYQTKGLFYDGSTPVAVQAAMVSNGVKVLFAFNGQRHQFDCKDLRVSPRSGDSERFITLPGGGQFQTRDHEFLDRFPQEVRSEGPVAWLESRLPVAIAGVVLIVAIIAGGYFYGLPKAADMLVNKLPSETEQALSKEMLAWFDENKWTLPSGHNEDT